MSGIGQRLAKLEQLERGKRSHGIAAWREQLAATFAAPVYDAYRDGLIDALCSGHPYHELVIVDDAGRERGREIVTWWGREDGIPPVTLQFTKDWRGVERGAKG